MRGKDRESMWGWLVVCPPEYSNKVKGERRTFQDIQTDTAELVCTHARCISPLAQIQVTKSSAPILGW